MARIVELAGHAAAYGGRLLAEMGHDVIRVEPPDGDDLRHLPPLVEGDSAYHHFLNAGKRSLALDLGSERGREALTALLDSADALLAQRPLPLDEAALDPGLAAVLMEDPLPEICTFARSGLLALTGHPDHTPMLLGGHAVYAATGAWAALALTAALFARQATGAGQRIELSAEDCLAVLGEQGVVAETVTRERFERRGYRGAVTAISGAFRCADGFAMLSVPASADSWARFMDWVGDPELAADTSLADEAERRARQAEVIDRLERWTTTFGKEDLVLQSQQRHTPAAPVSTALDLAGDPQLLDRGFLRQVDHPSLGPMQMPAGALATLRGAQPAPAPRLGQHNAEILAELGLS